MKTKLYLIIAMFLPILVLGQMSQPEFTGIKKINMLTENSSTDPFTMYVTKNFCCPWAPAECMPEGTVLVKFNVTPSGELTDFNVINSVCQDLDKEFIRILKSTDGMWNPVYENGIPVSMEKEVSLIFVKNPNLKNPKEYFSKNAEKYFLKGSKSLFDKNNPEKAIKFLNKSIVYRPHESATLLLRGLCYYQVGDKESAQNDWERVKELGKTNVDEYLEKIADLDGFEEMNYVLNE